MQVELKPNQVAVYELKGSKGSLYTVVNRHNQVMISRRGILMTYLGSSAEDAKAYYKELKTEVQLQPFGGQFDPEQYGAISVEVIEA